MTVGHPAPLTSFSILFARFKGDFVTQVLGTLAGYHARRRWAAARSRRDLPLALLEDAIAILGGFAVLAATAHL